MTITVHIRDKQRFFQDVTSQINNGHLYILEDGQTIAVFKNWDYYIFD